jgi:RNA polymerase sigma-70 factor (ECF subfamily)
MARVAEADRSDQVEADAEIPNGGPVGAWRFRLVLLRHHGVVYRVAFALLRDRQEAEDVAQETFLRYWQRGDGVRSEREWLLTVARNFALDRLRRARGSRGPYELPADEPGDDRDPVWHVQHDELATGLRERIAALPEPQRSLVILFDVHGLDGAACARILGLNANQVKVYLHRARRRLRRELEGLL